MPNPHSRLTNRELRAAGLPLSYDVHWSKSRKEDVVRAVHRNVISFEEARGRYLLSRKEFAAWEDEIGTGHLNRKNKEKASFELA